MKKLMMPAVLCAASAGLVALLAPQIASGAFSGSFAPAGSMTTPRYGGAAAPLPDGRVLIVGGSPDGGLTKLASAEIFDPDTNTFTSSGIGSMGTPRWSPSAAPLPGGKVLIAGGEDSTYLSSAEIFDPTTNTFSSVGVGGLGTARKDAAAAALPDGRVLLVGGWGGYALGDAEVFDPATKAFSSAGIGSPNYSHANAAAAPLPDGRVLIAAGGPAEVFNPSTNSFSSAGIGSMVTSREGAGAAPLADGRVLIAGGSKDNAPLASAEIFDPATNTFNSAGIGSMATPRGENFAAPMPGGRVLVAGGVSLTASSLPFYPSSAEIFTAVNTPDAAGPTGQRAAAHRNCKKKFPGKAKAKKRKKCIKKAKKLPV
jgi:Kelch motif